MCCCCCLPRCSLIFAGVWTLVLSIAWAILALIGILLYTCDITVEFGYFVYPLYFIYFFNPDCRSIPPELNFTSILENGFTTPADFTPPPGHTFPPLPEWPERFAQADYAHILILLYIGFNAAWAVTCIIVIVAATMNVRSWFAYAPWILMAAANIILDVVATIHFAIDAEVSRNAQGLLEELMGLDLTGIDLMYLNQLFGEFTTMGYITMIPSVVMALLSSRLIVFWIMNVLIFISVLVSVCRLSNKTKGKSQQEQTHSRNGFMSKGYHNDAYSEEPYINEPGPKHDHTDNHIRRRPLSFTGGDLMKPSTTPFHPLTNRDPVSSVAAPGTNLHCSATQPSLDLPHPRHPYHKPPAPGDHYGQQALNRMPVRSDLKGSNGANVQIRAPQIRRTDSQSSYQPSMQNRPPASLPFPRADLHRPAPRTDAEYLEPIENRYNSFSSTGYYEPPSSHRLPLPHDARGNNEPGGQSKASHLHRKESDRPAIRPPPPTKNLHGAVPSSDEVARPQDHDSKADRRVPDSRHRPSASQQRPELRNQLPWSYFGPRNEPMKPKPKYDPVTEEDMDKPPVPVPDYTLHFGKKARPAPPTTFDDAASVADSVASHRGTSASGVDRRSSFLENNRT